MQPQSTVVQLSAGGDNRFEFYYQETYMTANIMRDIVTPRQIYPALQALLGLPEHCVSFELRVAAEQVGVVVTCEHYVALDATGLKQLETVLSAYELVHRNPLADTSSPAVMGFDAWMHDRTERAHAAYMAGHASGGIDYSKCRKYANGGIVTGYRLVGEAA